MKARQEFRNRDATEVAILDALVDRRDGMTVFELRANVDVGIDDLENALSVLNDDGLIETEVDDRQTLIKPTEQVIPEPGENDHENSFFDRLRDRFGL